MDYHAQADDNRNMYDLKLQASSGVQFWSELLKYSIASHFFTSEPEYDYQFDYFDSWNWAIPYPLRPCALKVRPCNVRGKEEQTGVYGDPACKHLIY